MKNEKCKFYEMDIEARDAAVAYERACAADNPPMYAEAPPDSLCECYCKHCVCRDGFPGETLICCNHPENGHIIDCYSVFDGVEDETERMKILDAIC